MNRPSLLYAALLCGFAGACNDTVDSGLPALDIPDEPDGGRSTSLDPALADDTDASASSDAAVADAGPSTPADLTGIPSFAVHVSEYGQATGVTLLDGEGALVQEMYLASGMEKPGLSAALASDIALPSTPCDPTLVTVIGRQGANNVLQVDFRKNTVVRQVATQRAESNTSGAYQSNPQDILCLAGDRALVSRANPNLLPNAETLDLGDDLALLDLAAGTVSERISLDVFRETLAGGELAYARPGSIVQRGKYAVVGLSVYSQRYVAAVPGKVAVLDLADFTSRALSLTKLGNCGLVIPVADREDAVIVSCAGSPYGNPESAGLALVTLDADGVAAVAAEFRHAFAGAPLYASPTSLGGSRVIAVAADASFAAPDVAYVVDIVAGTFEKAFEGTAVGGVGSGAMRFPTGLVLVPDSGQGVRVFTQHSGELHEENAVALDLAVPARSVRPLRVF